jgi:hypothetical protein
MSAYGGGASAPPVPSNVEGGQAQGHVPDEGAKQQPTQMTLDFETAPTLK